MGICLIYFAVYKKFTVFKRVTSVLFGVSLAQAIASLLWLFPIRFTIKHCEVFWIYVFILPLALISLKGKHYFTNSYENKI